MYMREGVRNGTWNALKNGNSDQKSDTTMVMLVNRIISCFGLFFLRGECKT